MDKELAKEMILVLELTLPLLKTYNDGPWVNVTKEVERMIEKAKAELHALPG